MSVIFPTEDVDVVAAAEAGSAEARREGDAAELELETEVGITKAVVGCRFQKATSAK